jgi:hypothetical protein
VGRDLSGPGTRALASFLRAVAVLALPADDQLAWPRSLGLPGEPYYVDELALEFDDGYLLLSQFVANEWLPQRVVEPIAVLNTLLSDMSGPEQTELWGLEALAGSPLWGNVRHQARAVLFLL